MHKDHQQLAKLIRDAYTQAHDAFNNYEMWMHTSVDREIAFYQCEAEVAVSELVNKLRAAFEFLGLPETAARLVAALQDMSGSDFVVSERGEGLFSMPLDVIRPYVEIVLGNPCTSRPNAVENAV